MATITKENFAEIAAKHIANRGDQGHVLTTFDMSARLWMAYYHAKGLPTAFMEMQLRAGKSYTVPCQRPADFDPETKIRPVDLPRHDRSSSEMTLADRDAIVKRATAGMTLKRNRHGKYQDDGRDAKPLPPVARELTEGEIESMQRLLGVNTRKDAAE